MRAGWLIASVVFSACGGAARPAPKPTAVVVPTAAEADDPARTEQPPTAARAPAATSLEACVRELRQARELTVAPEERALYDRALAHEESSELSEARKSYFSLIQNHPSSRLIPLAYLAFGELFARDSAADPSKWDLARAAYGEVVKYPPPDNLSFAYASLRVADTRRAHDPSAALAQYKRALDASARYPTLPCSEAVRQSAERGLIDSYLSVGQPERAWGFLRAAAGDARARTLLRELALRYQQAGKTADACAVARGAGGDGAELARAVCP
jgi:predicted Zn-dependent protease